MRGKWFTLSASLVLLALAAIAVIVLPRATAKKAKPPEPVSQAPPAVGDINLSGKIRAQHLVGVAPPIEGTIGAFFAEIGQEVFEGQLLARLTNEGLETGEQSAKRDVEITQSRVNTLESEIVSARLEASRARADASRAQGEYDRLDKIHRRQQMLFNEGATPKLAFEKSAREFEQAQSEFRTLEQLAANAESRVADLVRNLDAEKRTLREKTDRLENASARTGATELVSPTQGMVVARNGEVGQSVAPDRADFFQIATQLSQLEVVLDPDPPTMRRIQPGNPAMVTLPDQGADGMLGSVKSIQGAQVVVEFTSPNPAVKPGMMAQVRIKTN
jgi:HlyD family secretion protein